LDKKTVIGMTFFLFLAASWLIGAMMNFQYETSASEVNPSFIGPFITIILFALPFAIFWRGKTKIFFIMFSAGLFFIITPVFFHSLRVLLFGLILLGSSLLFFALKRGYISSKKVAMMTAFLIWLGGFLFYLYYDKYDKAISRYSSFESYKIPTEIQESFTYIWDETGGGVESVGGPGLLILVMISVLALGFFTYQKLRPIYLSDSAKEDGEEKIESEITSTVDEAITNLHDGKDIESIILRCYQRMCRILEEEGVEDEDFMTPREFEMIATRKLTISSSEISNIREIFELTKYSSHELDEKEKNRVLEDLKSLKEGLNS